MEKEGVRVSIVPTSSFTAIVKRNLLPECISDAYGKIMLDSDEVRQALALKQRQLERETQKHVFFHVSIDDAMPLTLDVYYGTYPLSPADEDQFGDMQLLQSILKQKQVSLPAPGINNVVSSVLVLCVMRKDVFSIGSVKITCSKSGCKNLGKFSPSPESVYCSQDHASY